MEIEVSTIPEPQSPQMRRKQSSMPNQIPQRKQSSYYQKKHILQQLNEEISQDLENETSDFIHAFYNSLKTILGVGIITIPFALQQSGWVMGILILVLVAVLSIFYTNRVLKISENFSQANSFGDLGELIYGKKMRYFIEIIMVTYLLGTAISYLVFFQAFFVDVFKEMHYKIPRIIQDLFLFIILVPLSLNNNVHHLYKSSMFGVVCCFVTCLIIMYSDVHHMYKDDNIRSVENMYNFQNLSYFLGVSIFSFQGTGIIFYIKKSMSNQSEVTKVYASSVCVALILYIIYGILNVFALGHNTYPIIFKSLPKGDLFSVSMKIMFAFSLLMTYPLITIPCFKIIEQYLSRFILRLDMCQKQQMTYSQIDEIKQYSSYGVRCSFLIAIYLVALMIPKFTYFLSFLGGFSGVIFQFTIPAILCLKYYKNQMKFANFMLESMFITLSIIISFIVGYSLLKQEFIHY